jgi:hypothetical protein
MKSITSTHFTAQLCLLLLITSCTYLFANEPQKPIFNNNQAKTPDFSLLENHKKNSLINQNPFSILKLDQNNLDNPENTQFIPPARITIDDNPTDKKNKNWLQDDLKKLKEARLERQGKTEEKEISAQESFHRRTDIFSLGINQPKPLSNPTQQAIFNTNISQQVSSIDLKPAISQNIAGLNPSASARIGDSILNTSTSLQTGLQNIQQHTSNRNPLDPDTSPLNNNFTPQLNTSALNDALMPFKPQQPNLQIKNPSMQAAQQLGMNPLSPNNTHSLNINSLNNINSTLSPANPFATSNTNFNNLLNPPQNSYPKVLGNPNLNPNKITDPLERLYR